jgi:membrane dipeptidase
LGVPVDVSHASDRATRDVLSLARESGVPVIATHSNARAVTDARRNLADAEIRAIAESGGVVGVNFHSRFLVKGRRATIDDVVRQIQYLVRLVGVEHVAIGSDFEGDILPPRGLEDVRAMPALARALEHRGLSRSAVERIFGLNALRVLCGRQRSE